jgi:trehalose/maltose transport system permease protein
MNKGLGFFAGRTLFYLLLLVILVYMVFPFYWSLNSSLKTEAELQQTPATFVPNNPTAQNYFLIFRNDRFVRGLINSLIVASCTTAFCLFVGSFGAFALGKLRFRGKTLSLYVILAMTMFPGVAVLSGLYAVITTLRMPPILAMILSYMIFTLPFTVWVLTSFFKDLPIEIMRSAQVDGATAFQTFYLILLPLTLPALVTTGLLSFIAAWNEYLFALTFTTIDPAARTVPVAIRLFTGEVAHQEPFGQIMAAAIVVTIPLVILVLIFQQKIVAGLTAGAVKG